MVFLLSTHINLKHALHTKSSAIECQWVEKECKQCAKVIFIRPEWEYPELRCSKCCRESWMFSKKMEKKKDIT